MSQVKGKAGKSSPPRKAGAHVSPFAAIEDAVRKQLAEINAIGEISVHSPDIMKLYTGLLALAAAGKVAEEDVHAQLDRIMRVVRKLERTAHRAST